MLLLLHPLTDVDAYRALFAGLTRHRSEMAALAYLACDGRLLGLRHTAGERDRIALPIRAVAADALTLNATAVVLAHNHPSGDPRPSDADLAFTRRLARGLDALGVTLHDHLVLAGEAMTSLRQHGLL